MRKAKSMYCTVQLVRTTRTIHYLAKGDWQVAIVDVRIGLKVVICTVTIQNLTSFNNLMKTMLKQASEKNGN